jgi:hypothetical protein
MLVITCMATRCQHLEVHNLNAAEFYDTRILFF